MNWFSQSWLPTAIGAWSGPINTALMRVDPSSIPIAVWPSMMAWLVLIAMSLTLPNCLETLGETVLGLVPADAIREAAPIGGTVDDQQLDATEVSENRPA
jgi:hypothetical protein